MMLPMLLDRASAEENVHALRAVALRDVGAVTDTLVERRSGTVRRLEGVDSNGRPLVVEIDPRTGRMLLTITWTSGPPERQQLRIMTAYEYPDPATVDPALFDAVPAEATQVVEWGDLEKARYQCMSDLRGLAVLVHMYAARHEDRLPETIDQLTPFSDQPIDELLARELPGVGVVKVRSRLKELDGTRVSDADDPASVVLFECRLPDGVVKAFLDGHVEFEADEP
ncbi:MAG: hypothetical protein ACYTGC_03795 [Planctomycetota bacterium]|jgi:hypothetical protein